MSEMRDILFLRIMVRKVSLHWQKEEFHIIVEYLGVKAFSDFIKKVISLFRPQHTEFMETDMPVVPAKAYGLSASEFIGSVITAEALIL